MSKTRSVSGGEQPCRTCNKPPAPAASQPRSAGSAADGPQPTPALAAATSEVWQEDEATPFPEWALEADVELEKSNILLLVWLNNQRPLKPRVE